MRAIVLSRLIAVMGSVAAMVACEDTLSPRPPLGSPAAGITVVPRSATIRAGQVATLQARLIDEFGQDLEGDFSWKSSNDAVATVSTTGQVYGRSEGTVVVTASALGKAQTSTIRVLQRESKPDSPDGKGGKPLLLRGQLQ